MRKSGIALARNLTKLLAGLCLFAVIWIGSGTAASAQFQIGVGGGSGTTIGNEKQQRSRDDGRHEERTRHERRSGPQIGIQLNVGEIRPAYCYTHTFGSVVTCRKRSLGGETCQGDCILSGNGTAIGPAPPAHAKAPDVSYRCTCGD